MRSIKAMIKRRVVLNALCVAACLCPLFLSYWTSSKASNNSQNGFRIINRARNLTVVRTTAISNEMFELTVRNDYDDLVTSYAYSFDQGGYNSTQEAMRPGDISKSLVSLPRPEVRPHDPVLTILAVAFKDNTGDGDLRVVNDLIQTQMGQAVQVERINNLFKDLPRGMDHDLLGRLTKLKADIANLPDPPEAETSFSFAAAVHNENKAGLEKVEELEEAYRKNGLERFQIRLDKLQEIYQRRNNSYIPGPPR
jgi:hypothetical protein